ncbi:MAG: hypothetical protein AAGI46_08800 [Planctomycetota bacterium]
MSKHLASLLVVLCVAAGCSKPKPTPMLAEIYNPELQKPRVEERPVVVLPGILGTRLRQNETDRVVWGAFTGGYANPGRPDGAALVALPMAPGVPLDELTDDVRPDGALDTLELRILNLPVKLSAYVDILRTLGVAGYADQSLLQYSDEHFTCFQFDYDWRRDNAENAAKLYRRLVEIQAYTHEQLVAKHGVDNVPPREEIKIDLVAHSMGGLVARYMLRYGDAELPADGSMPELTWKGAKLVDRLIMVGTPNAGSVDAFRQLVEGKDFSSGSVAFWLPFAPPVVLGSMPSIYQLLPRPRHEAIVLPDREAIDLYDADFWISRRLGLAGNDQVDELGWILGDDVPIDQRRAVAEDHLRKVLARAEQFHDAIDVPATRPAGLNIHLFAGDAVDTDEQLVLRNDNTIDTLRKAAGDGTVLRSSALMDERLNPDLPGRASASLTSPIDWSGVFFLFQDHLGITKSPEFTDNVLFLLLEAP